MKNKKVVQKYLTANIILPAEDQLGALLLGDCNSAVSVSVLKPNQVQTIVSIGLEAQPPKNKIPQDVTHHVLDIHDNKQQKLSVQLLDQVSSIIDKGRRKGGVLVHCYAGVSRSSSFVIAYIINTYILDFDDAKLKVQKKRSCIHPGDGFVHHLKNYAKVVLNRKIQAQKGREVLKIEEPEEVIVNQSVTLAQKTKRGVRGAVRSAQHSQLKAQLTKKQLALGKKVQQGPPIQEDIKEQKPPTVHQPKYPSQEKYKKSSSRVLIQQGIDKIEGKQKTQQGPSIQKIYTTKTKVH